MKERIKHWPSTLLGLALFGLVAWLHFSGRVLISEWEEFITGAEALLVLIGTRYLLMKPKAQGMTAPPDEEPVEPPTTPFPNPTTPRPKK